MKEATDEPIENLPGEEWLPVADPEFSDLYEISSQGRVRSLDRRVAFGKQSRLVKGRILKHRHTGTHTKYPTVVLSNGEARKQRMVQRLVLEAFVGPAPEGHEAYFIDNDRANVSLNNLRWATHQEVMDKQETFSTRSRGDSHWTHLYPEKVRRGEEGTAKLTQEQVDEIRRRSRHHTYAEIARMYDVSPATVGFIVTYNTWRGGNNTRRNGNKSDCPMTELGNKL